MIDRKFYILYRNNIFYIEHWYFYIKKYIFEIKKNYVLKRKIDFLRIIFKKKKTLDIFNFKYYLRIISCFTGLLIAWVYIVLLCVYMNIVDYFKNIVWYH